MHSYRVDNSKTKLGVAAPRVDKAQLAEIVIPDRIRDEIPTLNRTGYMKLDLDEYSGDFIRYSIASKDIVLEIGCAYGFVVQKVLENGGKIIAADASEDHLSVLLNGTREACLDRLFLYEGVFPNGMDFPSSSIGAVLVSRVMHLLRGEEVELGLSKIHNWLVDGGRLYFTAVTPYHDSFKEGFLSTYKKLEQEGNLWPGIIENQWELAPQHKPYMQPFLNVFDIPQLERLLPAHGFEIEQISLFDYPNETGAGKNHVGFKAKKTQK